MSETYAWEPEPEYRNIFMDICVEQRRLGNLPGTPDWLQPFRDILGFDMAQIERHWYKLVKKWKTWCNLIECSEMKWDPETNTFGASGEVWANYLQVNPDAGVYRMCPLPLFLEKLKKIFEGCNFYGANDDEAGSSRCKKRKNWYGEEEEEVDDNADIDIDDDALKVSKNRTRFDAASHDLFLDLLVQETCKGDKPPRKYFKKATWDMMRARINETGKDFNLNHMKNHWDSLRKSWKIWCRLAGDPSMKWDPKTNRFGATEKDWELHLKENPKAETYKRKPIKGADKLELIFLGVIEPGKHLDCRCKPSCPFKTAPQEVHAPTTLVTNEPAVTRDDDDEPRTDVPICTPDEAKRLSSLTLTPKQYEYTIGECIERLDEIEKVGRCSDLYLFALDLFLRRDYRETFLKLKTPRERMTWLLKLQAAGVVFVPPKILI